jgi:hypothetical protein
MVPITGAPVGSASRRARHQEGVIILMDQRFIRIRNRLINLSAISYVRFYDEIDRIDIRLVGPAVDVSLTVSVEGEEAAPVREYFLQSGLVKDLRPPGN